MKRLQSTKLANSKDCHSTLNYEDEFPETPSTIRSTCLYSLQISHCVVERGLRSLLLMIYYRGFTTQCTDTQTWLIICAATQNHCVESSS